MGGNPWDPNLKSLESPNLISGFQFGREVVGDFKYICFGETDILIPKNCIIIIISSSVFW